MTDTFWQEKHDDYAVNDWSKKPSIFAQEVVQYFPAGASILELGCGQGQDGLWFADMDKGLTVRATDFEDSALRSADERKNERGIEAIDFETLDLRQLFPYEDEMFDVVYAHLALHYFDKATTEQVFSEIYRVLRPDGIVAFLVNSVNDPEYNTGEEIEKDYFVTIGTRKRYFSAQTVREFARKFEVVMCDEQGETYKDRDKGVHNLVRFVGRKSK